MTSKEMDELLSNIISMFAPAFGRGVTKKAAQKLASSSIERKIQSMSGDAYARAKAALSKCGTVLEENSADRIISGIIFSGAANMNPSFVLIWIECNTIHIRASAKEGFIKQHTAERAVKIFESAFDIYIES